MNGIGVANEALFKPDFARLTMFVEMHSDQENIFEIEMGDVPKSAVTL